MICVLYLFFLMSLAKGLSILFIFSKNHLLVSLIFAFIFFISIPFTSALVFMIYFLLLTLGFVCSSFSSCFWWKVRLFIWEFSCFLRYDCTAINFPFRTAFAASHKFESSCFCCLLFLGTFWFPLWFLKWSLGYLVAYCLASMCLYFLQFFFPLIVV